LRIFVAVVELLIVFFLVVGVFVAPFVTVVIVFVVAALKRLWFWCGCRRLSS